MSGEGRPQGTEEATALNCQVGPGRPNTLRRPRGPREQRRCPSRAGGGGCTPTTIPDTPLNGGRAASAAGWDGQDLRPRVRRARGHSDPLPPRSPGIRAPPGRQRKPLCAPHSAHRAQRAILLHTLASVSPAAAARGPPSWHAQEPLLALFHFFFLLLFKEKWWEAPLGYVCDPAMGRFSG